MDGWADSAAHQVPTTRVSSNKMAMKVGARSFMSLLDDAGHARGGRSEKSAKFALRGQNDIAAFTHGARAAGDRCYPVRDLRYIRRRIGYAGREANALQGGQVDDVVSHVADFRQGVAMFLRQGRNGLRFISYPRSEEHTSEIQ